MSKLNIFLTLSGYQLTWMLCIFGELIYNSPLPGLLSGIIFILVAFLYSNNKKKLISVLILLSIPGYLFDSILVFFEVYEFQTSFYFYSLPVWMLVLWPSFAILFDKVFVFLSNYKVLAVLLSAILGPLTYYSGSPLGLIVINKFYLFFFLMIIFWIFLMLYYLNFLLKLRFN